SILTHLAQSLSLDFFIFYNLSIFFFFFFFFQAEDGIRDPLVTGVQTCALPISFSLIPPTGSTRPRRLISPVIAVSARTARSVKRSEERRVGKECRSRWWAKHQKKKEGCKSVVVMLYETR